MSDHDFHVKTQAGERIVFVRPSTPVPSLATLLRSLIEDQENTAPVVTRSMGAGATNQAVKAWAVVTKRLESRGIKVLLIPYFERVEWRDGKESSAVSLRAVVQGVGLAGV